MTVETPSVVSTASPASSRERETASSSNSLIRTITYPGMRDLPGYEHGSCSLAQSATIFGRRRLKRVRADTPDPDQSVTAPRLLVETSAAYLASTPRV